MANNEAQFRSELKKDIETLGGFCKVISQKFFTGYPDLHASLPGVGSAWIECKFEARADYKGRCPLKLTPLQREFIRREQRAGGNAGWVLCIKFSKLKQWAAYCGRSPDETEVDLRYPRTVRAAGRYWGVTEIMESIVEPRENYDYSEV